MWFPILGLLAGIILGSLSTVTVPVIYAKYLSIAVIAALDSILGGVRSILSNNFDGTILITGFIVNAALAAGLAFLGDKLGLDLYLAAVFTFGFRLFSNIGVIRRILLDKYRQNKKNKPPKGQRRSIDEE